MLVTDALTAEVQPDSSIIVFKQTHQKSLGEKIVNFPTKVIYFPFKYSMMGINWTVGYIDDRKIPARISDFLTSDDGLRGVRPKYSPRLGIGVEYFQKALFGHNPDFNRFSVSVSTWDFERQEYRIDFKEFQIFRDRLTAGLSGGYFKLTIEPFYGVGIESDYDNESNYTREQSFAEANLGHFLLDELKLEGRIGYETINTSAGNEEYGLSTTDLYNSQTLPGLSDQADLVHAEVGVVIDTKDRPGNPTKGFDVILSGGAYTEIGNNRFGYWHSNFDITRYIHLFYDRVIAVRLAAQRNDPMQDRTIPFYNLAELGETETIRGFKRGRFRDRDMILGSLEYRWPVWRSWEEYGVDFLIFGDAGQVSNDLFEGVYIDDFKTGVGGGLRFWGRAGLILRIEAGHSENGWRFYFVLN